MTKFFLENTILDRLPMSLSGITHMISILREKSTQN